MNLQQLPRSNHYVCYEFFPDIPNVSGCIPQCSCTSYLWFFFFRGVKVTYLHISPFYFSLVILAFLTHFNNMKRITSFTCLSSFIASISLNTDLLPSYLQLFLGCFTCVFPILFNESLVQSPRGYFHICKKKFSWGKQTTGSWNYCYYTKVYIKLFRFFFCLFFEFLLFTSPIYCCCAAFASTEQVPWCTDQLPSRGEWFWTESHAARPDKTCCPLKPRACSLEADITPIILGGIKWLGATLLAEQNFCYLSL